MQLTSSSSGPQRAWRSAVILILAVALVGGGAWAIAANSGSKAPAPTPAELAKGRSYGHSLSQAFRDAADRVRPSVVMITNRPTMAKIRTQRPSDKELAENPFSQFGSPFGDLMQDPNLRRFFKNMPQGPRFEMPQRHGHAVGSGMIIDASGLILTNNHVVDGNGQILVRLSDGREFKAVSVKGDPKTDLAIVRIEGAGKLQPVALGDSDATQVGDWVLALGQPFGLEDTLTAGIISAKGRGIGETARDNFLQTDAAINPGNSGGPLVNLDGEVIGINTAITSSSGGFQGVGFAVPVNLAKWVAHQLDEKGSVQRSYLGVGIQPVNQELADQFQMKRPEGVLVTDVRPDSPAAKAGLQSGDVILKYAGKPVNKTWQLQAMVEETPSGSKQPLVVLRDGKETTLNITPAVQPANYGEREEGAPEVGQKAAEGKLGLAVETLTPQVAERLNVSDKSGVVITEVQPGSVAHMAGLREGMVITQVNRKPVRDAEQFAKMVKDSKDGVLLLVRTEQGSRFVVLSVDKEPIDKE